MNSYFQDYRTAFPDPNWFPDSYVIGWSFVSLKKSLKLPVEVYIFSVIEPFNLFKNADQYLNCLYDDFNH